MLLMSKLTAIKNARNGSETALRLFSNIWAKIISYWNTINPRDNIAKMVLECI